MRYALLLPLLTGCAAFLPPDAEPFTPPASYRAVWDSAQACTGLVGDFSRLRFFVVEGDGIDAENAAATKDGRIVIASYYRLNPMVVKHEMIHALGVHNHPAHPFVDPCHATWESNPGGALLEDR